MRTIGRMIICLAFGMVLIAWGAYFAKGGAVEAAPSVSYDELVKLVENNKSVNDIIYKRLLNVEKQGKIKVPKELDVIQWVEPGKQ